MRFARWKKRGIDRDPETDTNRLQPTTREAQSTDNRQRAQR